MLCFIARRTVYNVKCVLGILVMFVAFLFRDRVLHTFQDGRAKGGKGTEREGSTWKTEGSGTGRVVKVGNGRIQFGAHQRWRQDGEGGQLNFTSIQILNWIYIDGKGTYTTYISKENNKSFIFNGL